MIILTFNPEKLPESLTRKKEKALLDRYKQQLTLKLSKYLSQEKNVQALNSTTIEVFKEYGLQVQYAGPYGILSEKPEVSNPLVASYGAGCTDISIYTGVIGTAFREYGHSVYVPSTKQLEKFDSAAHHECRNIKDPTKKPDLAEIVIALRKSYKLPNTTSPQPVGQQVYDIDIQRPNAFSINGVCKLEEVLLPYLESIFPGGITFRPVPGIHIRPSTATSHEDKRLEKIVIPNAVAYKARKK